MWKGASLGRQGPGLCVRLDRESVSSKCADPGDIPVLGHYFSDSRVDREVLRTEGLKEKSGQCALGARWFGGELYIL